MNQIASIKSTRFEYRKKTISGNKHSKFMVNIILLFIYPLFTLPYIITGIKRREWGAFVCLALFMAMLGYLIVPMEKEDLFRIYEGLEEFQGLTWEGRLLILGTKMDFFLSSLYIFVDQFSISKEWIPFISVLIGYISYTFIFYDWQKRNPSLQEKYIYSHLLIITLSIISFRSYALNIRNFVAVSSLIYGVYLLYFRHKKAGWIFVAISPACHAMTALVLPIVFIARFNIPTKWCRWFFLISFICIFVDMSGPINDFFSSFTFDNKELNGRQGHFSDDDANIGISTGAGYNTNGLIVLAYGYIINILIYLYLIKVKVHSSLIRNLVYLTMGFSNMLFYVSLLYGRYLMVAEAFFYLMLLMEYRDHITNIYQKKFLKIYPVLVCISFLMSMYMTRESMVGCLRILYEPPVYFLFMS